MPCTGAALFSWKKDDALLRPSQKGNLGKNEINSNDDNPSIELDFEFRVLSEYRNEVEKLIIPNWEERWKMPDAGPTNQDFKKSEFYIEPFYEFYKKAKPKKTQPWLASQQVIPIILTAVLIIIDYLLDYSGMTLFLVALMALSTLCLIPRKPKRNLVFFYGTLRKGYHWNEKFLTFSKFVSFAHTAVPVFLVVGESGVPYV